MSHTPGPWIWMDVSEQIGVNNTGLTGVDWLGPDRDDINSEESYVLQFVQDCDNWPESHPYRKRFHHKTTGGGIAVLNLDDLPLIAAAPELLEACKNVLEFFGYDTQPDIDALEAAIAKAEGK